MHRTHCCCTCLTWIRHSNEQTKQGIVRLKRGHLTCYTCNEVTFCRKEHDTKLSHNCMVPLTDTEDSDAVLLTPSRFLTLEKITTSNNSTNAKLLRLLNLSTSWNMKKCLLISLMWCFQVYPDAKLARSLDFCTNRTLYMQKLLCNRWNQALRVVIVVIRRMSIRLPVCMQPKARHWLKIDTMLSVMFGKCVSVLADSAIRSYRSRTHSCISQRRRKPVQWISMCSSWPNGIRLQLCGI